MNIAVLPAPLVIAVTSAALFNAMGKAHASGNATTAAPVGRVGMDEDDDGDGSPLSPGSMFTLVRKLLALNTDACRRVEVVLVSSHGAKAGLRVLRAIGDHGLAIKRAAFTHGAPCHRYAAAFGAHLFLSTDAADVQLALAQGVAAATVKGCAASAPTDGILRIAFDGDAVLFSDEAEQVYTRAGLDAFIHSEQARSHVPLEPGPFQPFLMRLHQLQNQYQPGACPLRTALVTARSVAAHERALRTLGVWGVEVDEAIFLGGMDKGPALRSFGADIFFDDQQHNCDRASTYVPSAHVPYGIKNRPVHPALRRVA